MKYSIFDKFYVYFNDSDKKYLCNKIEILNIYNIKEGGITMVSEFYKKKASSLTRKAKENDLVKTYKDFCKTKLANETALSEEEIAYYTSRKKEENN